MSSDTPIMMKVKEVAAALQVTPRTVYRLSDAGRIPQPIKIGASVRWRRDEMEAWAKDGCPVVRPSNPGRVRE